MVYGIIYNSSMWGGYYFGDCYNWYVYVNGEGYYIFVIDRFGYGFNLKVLDLYNVI